MCEDIEIVPAAGEPFYAVIASMRPKPLLNRIFIDKQKQHIYDQFGFVVDGADVAESHYKQVSGDDPQHQQEWQAHLGLSMNSNIDDLTSGKMSPTIPYSNKLNELVCKGIPHGMRSKLWLRISGALTKKVNSNVTYREVLEASWECGSSVAKAIEKDLLRTLPNNASFSNFDSPGIPSLRRVLRGIAWLYPDHGYCQGTGVIVAHLLLFLKEDDVFWMMCAIIEDLLPPLYYSENLIGANVDQRVLRQLLMEYLPETDQILLEYDIDLALICLPWFITIMAGVVKTDTLLRIWDLFFLKGSIVLFKVALGILKYKEASLQAITNHSDLLSLYSDHSYPLNADELFQVTNDVTSSLTRHYLELHRRKHMVQFMSYCELSKPLDCAKPQMEGSRKKNYLRKFVFGSDIDEKFKFTKAKNIRQTELVSELRHAIISIVEHFQCGESSKSVIFCPDYSAKSHQQDRENFMNVSLQRRQRAKALLNFKQHDDDELGFCKNDIISIIDMKDEHCWVGELNSRRGWFPAKFVELLDERSKIYSNAGDDTVNDTITDLVRGGLCPAIAAVFEHGLKHSIMLGSSCHPWLFIEEASNFEVEKDFNSVFSRLVLCKTFRLDEDGKVLAPEELLYRCVQAVNQTHNGAHAQMDVKFRSLICLGLNEQVLHLWLEILCSCGHIVSKWYHPWSYIMSPGWVQLKCDLRVLSQHTFYLSQDWELPEKKESKETLKVGVRDMLVKHHLFSWDL